jgi:hypothetical protein
MKKIFTLSTLTLAIVIFLTSCVREVPPFNDGYWLSKQRGEVVYSSSSCPYYVIQTNFGYTVAVSNSKPLVGEVLYGDFNYYGVQDVYNRTVGIVISTDVKEYGLTYNGAQDALDYYCY